MPIATLDDLRQHIQWAIELEHATIPPYLCALYSIKPGQNRECVEVLTSVFIEEMLHMTLAANVLNAVGGSPVIDSPDFIARYPAYLPHSADAFLVPLARFNPETLETFLKIEKPEETGASPSPDRYDTIGQFYRAIEEGLVTLSAELGEKTVFCGDPTRQVTPEMLAYHASGRIVPVYDLKSALEAIDEIEEQGEGLKHLEVWDGDRDMFHPKRHEVAHYFRFMEIKLGRSYRRGDTPQSGPSGRHFNVDWDAVYPMRENPRREDFAEDSPVRAKMDQFNVAYSEMLRDIQRALNGQPERFFASVPAMLDLRDLARDLARTPTGDGVTTAGPSFDYMPAARRADAAAFRVTVRANGPYVVEGDVPLRRKSIVYSEWGEPLTWRTREPIPTDASYRLCRCGHSAHKPFCDGTHAHIDFDGTETAPVEPSETRRLRFDGEKVSMTDDRVLCADAGFCGNRIEKVWQIIERTEDTQVRFQLMQMVERCPSGRLTYELEDGPLEPDLPKEIAPTKDGPYWVTGGIPVIMSDSRSLEVRNRIALCRCGQSKNKPLCDGTHAAIKFRDG
jgi:CDGSH-type Zn-finger protein